MLLMTSYCHQLPFNGISNTFLMVFSVKRRGTYCRSYLQVWVEPDEKC